MRLTVTIFFFMDSVHAWPLIF